MRLLTLICSFLGFCITPANHSRLQNAPCNVKNMSQSEAFPERHVAHLLRLHTREPPPNEDAWNSRPSELSSYSDGSASNGSLLQGWHFSWILHGHPGHGKSGCIPHQSLWYRRSYLICVSHCKWVVRNASFEIFSTSVTVLFAISLCFFQPAATPTPPLPFQVALRHRYSLLAYKVLTGPRHLANRTSL
jgi:hypothetical protein